VSVSALKGRGASRRVARIARDLLPNVRRTDVIVRVADERLLLLPGGDNQVAASVLARCVDEERTDLLVGIAAFPGDGPTFAALREVAEACEQPWPAGGRPGADQRPGRLAGGWLAPPPCPRG
jgi:hypothetical protein